MTDILDSNAVVKDPNPYSDVTKLNAASPTYDWSTTHICIGLFPCEQLPHHNTIWININLGTQEPKI